jgi:hypothetical protein
LAEISILFWLRRHFPPTQESLLALLLSSSSPVLFEMEELLVSAVIL